MKESEYFELADRLAERAGVAKESQAYFRLHRTRLAATLASFGLWELSGKRILEIGPFYSYTPFLFRSQKNEVSVLEGTNSVVAPLLPLYQQEGIECRQCNLLRVFALTTGEAGKLPYPDASFDAVLCWETMEHFNFNPVVFTRELHRVLGTNGRAFITVPNQAKLHFRLKLLFGLTVRTPIEQYFSFVDYNCGEFLGFHWREYVLSELVELFTRSGFHPDMARHLNSWQGKAELTFPRRIKRALASCAIAVIPSLAANCILVARKS